MSRPLRIEFPGAYYHVMNRGRRSENIFYNILDYITFIELLREAIDLWELNLFAYTLMPNHYHLLVQTPLGNLSRFMRHVDGVYTQRFNKNHKTEGQLFKGRYKSILVEKDSYLLQLVKYVHRNSLKAGLVNDIDEFRWSSHPAYLSYRTKLKWLNKEYILSMMGDSPTEQQSEYIQFVNEVESEEIFKILKKSKWPTILGNNTFKEEIKSKYTEKKFDKEIPDSVDLLPEISLIKSCVCQYYNLYEDILENSTRGIFNEPRNIAIYLTRMIRQDTLSSIGDYFGLKRYSSVSSVVNRVEYMVKKDKKIRAKIKDIRDLITKSQT